MGGRAVTSSSQHCRAGARSARQKPRRSSEIDVLLRSSSLAGRRGCCDGLREGALPSAADASTSAPLSARPNPIRGFRPPKLAATSKSCASASACTPARARLVTFGHGRGAWRSRPGSSFYFKMLTLLLRRAAENVRHIDVAAKGESQARQSRGAGKVNALEQERQSRGADEVHALEQQVSIRA